MESEDHYVSIGTALDPIEEDDAPKKKPVPIADQIVTDEKGRRRFHGAFTGGFSAGYFNTVGTKEGWTPSTFKSTRASRGEAKSQNVQDFMDEEDLGAFGIAPQILRPTSEFQQEAQRPGKITEQTGPIPGTPVLDQIIQPVRDTVGVRILLRLGWRHGKGLGPAKLRKSKPSKDTKAKEPEQDSSKPTTSEKVYGCMRPENFDQSGGLEMESETSDDEDLDHFVLPDDNEDVLCNPKENLFGLGYSGLDRNTLSFGNNNLLESLKFRVQNKNLSIRGEAFGIGAFEDEDEEVYSRVDASEYDFALETPDERKSRKLQERGSVKKRTDERDTGIAGFVRAKSSSGRLKFYPAPAIPKNFVSMHEVKQSRFQAAQPGTENELKADESKKLGLDRHKLTAEERKVLLNDALQRIPVPAKEIMTEAAAEEARKKLAAERADRLLQFTSILEKNRPHSEPAFKPFVNNPEKQERYEKYTTLAAAGFEESLKDLQPLDMTEWERERETNEFKRALSLYKPLAGVISSRFISAKSHDISNQAIIKEPEKEKLANEDPHVAAKMNLFGKLTHEIFEWHPDRLLCKRFNVPHPYPESKIVGIPNSFIARSDATSSAGVLPPVEEETPGPSSSSESGTAESTSKPAKKSLFDGIDFSKPPPGLLPQPVDVPDNESAPNSVPIPDTNQENIAPEPIKPSKDLFKEIFANTSESESESEEEVVQPRKLPAHQTNIKQGDRQQVIEVKSDEEEDEDMYGPQLPAAPVLKTSSSSSQSIKFIKPQIKKEENLWVEKEVLSKKVKVHKSKKSKKHKEKHRHKDKSSKGHKKKKKRKASRHESDSSSDSEPDEDDAHTSERIKNLLSTLRT